MVMVRALDNGGRRIDRGHGAVLDGLYVGLGGVGASDRSNNVTPMPPTDMAKLCGRQDRDSEQSNLEDENMHADLSHTDAYVWPGNFEEMPIGFWISWDGSHYGLNAPAPDEDWSFIESNHCRCPFCTELRISALLSLSSIAVDMFNSETRRGWITNGCSSVDGVEPNITEREYVDRFVEQYRGYDIGELEGWADVVRPSNRPTAYEREMR
jgi:hypothetical protein